MLAGAFAIIVLLTWALVAMNIHAVVTQFAKDQNVVRLYCFLATLLLAGSLIIGVASAVIQRVIDAENFLELDRAKAPTRYYRR